MMFPLLMLEEKLDKVVLKKLKIKSKIKAIYLHGKNLYLISKI